MLFIREAYVQKTSGLSERDQRDQARRRDQVRGIECRTDRGRGMR